MNLSKIVGCVVMMALAACTAQSGADGEEEASASTSQAQTTGPAFYVDGRLYRTVGTPTDLTNTGAPLSSFDVIYNLRRAQPYNVAAVGPGQRGFNGGRWMVHAIDFPAGYAAALAAHDANHSGDFDSNEEVEAALAAGAAKDLGVVKIFECPVIPLPQNE
jgi:hypothetical protein